MNRLICLLGTLFLFAVRTAGGVVIFRFAFPSYTASLGQPPFASAQTAVVPSDGGWPLFYVAAPVVGTSVFWISNTENDPFLQKTTGTFGRNAAVYGP